MKSVLVVDDELSAQRSYQMVLKGKFDIMTASNGREAIKLMKGENPDAVILDIIMPGMDGIEVLKRIKKMDTDIPVVVVTATKMVRTAVEAMKLGAFDYITKPFDVDELEIIIAKALNERGLLNEVRYLREEVGKDYRFENIMGESREIQDLKHLITQIARARATVLISGESGTGKELVARAIHYNSPRGNKPFVVVHCAALTETLLESEIFGHEKGSFTDAREKKLGRFELADMGTIFLDEISEMSPSVQVKLLRVLQDQEFMRVGGTSSVKVDVRVVTATNKDLEQVMREGRFREDLYYRINVVPVFIPPLRQRGGDVPILARHFLEKYEKELNSPVKEISPKAMKLLEEYAWPGNVRELENVIERAVVLADKEVILPEDLPMSVKREVNVNGLKASVLSGEISLEDAKNNFERDLIKEALSKVGGTQTEAARLLKTTRRIFKYRMDKLGIDE